MTTDTGEAPIPSTGSDRAFHVLNALVSVAALAVIGWILVVREPAGDAHALRFLPALNATMNALAASCLFAGWLAIRRKRRALHRGLMLAALGASTLFLAGYLTYHWAHGDTRYPADAPGRGAYLAVLAVHVIGSIACLPMVLSTLAFALRGRFASHRRLARVTLPLWLAVSVTGVAVFLMLRTAGV